MIIKYIWHLLTMQKTLYKNFVRDQEMYATIREYRSTLRRMPDLGKRVAGVHKLGEIIMDDNGDLEFIKVFKEDEDEKGQDVG